MAGMVSRSKKHPVNLPLLGGHECHKCPGVTICTELHLRIPLTGFAAACACESKCIGNRMNISPFYHQSYARLVVTRGYDYEAAAGTEGTRRAGGAGAVAARASAAPHEAVGGPGSFFAMRKTERVKSPLVITGITYGASHRETSGEVS